MFTQETNDAIDRVAREFGLEAAALAGIAEVETDGRAFVAVDGRNEPLIRFEGHYFDRRLSPDKRARARALGLSSPAPGVVANPVSQAERWRLLERAAGIDAAAAWESTSWGLGQVMGAHWAWLGYATVDALVAETRESAAGQIRLMARYILKAGLVKPLALHDWPAVARGYNGPGYRANRYDTRLAQAFARHAAGGAVAPAPIPPLRRGDRGEAVRDLQAALSGAGYPVAVDGAFGPLTQDAVERFQRDAGLSVDGIVGPRTRAALRQALSLTGRLRKWWRRLISMLRARMFAAD